jgi:hypothetical protein
MEWSTTDDIRGDTWRRVLEYANVDLALDAIAARHGSASTSGKKSNYRKQAQQVRVAVLQAHEYFQAAERATLFTSPNHLYYGVYALASAIMLLRGSGEKSFDRLRQDSKNTHHGLKFTTGARATQVADGTTLFDTSHVEVLNDGHFLNWFAELPRRIPVFVKAHREANDVRTTSMETFGRIAIGTRRQMMGRKNSLRYLIQYLPDLDRTLSRYLVPVVSSRITHEVEFDKRGTATHSWTIHNAGDRESLVAILERFRFSSGLYKSVHVINEDFDDSILFEASLRRGTKERFFMPSSRWTTDYQQVVYDVPLGHEFVDVYRLCFGLSMLARYYPDLWIACLESHCRAAKLIEEAVTVMMRKAPVLVLELITGHPVVVSVQQPPWHH